MMKKIPLSCLLLLLFFSAKLSAQTNNSVRVFVEKAGTLINNFTENDANNITHLTLTGTINAIDFKHLRSGFAKLEILDLTNVRINTYAGKEGTKDGFYIYTANHIPPYAFSAIANGKPERKSSLKQVILSEKIKNIEDYAFKGCNNLKILQVNKKMPPTLSEGALNDNITVVFIPLGSRDSYRLKKNWSTFTLVEGEPVYANVQIGQGENLRDMLQKHGYFPNNINYLTIEGKLDEADFLIIRDYMPNLVSVNLTETSVTHIPDFVFSHKKYLMDIQLPKALRSIGERSFSNCERLTGNVVLPQTVDRIDYGAFMGCSNLKKVIVTGDVPTTLGDNLFGGESKLTINN
jgi:hypothetical protein